MSATAHTQKQNTSACDYRLLTNIAGILGNEYDSMVIYKHI